MSRSSAVPNRGGSHVTQALAPETERQRSLVSHSDNSQCRQGDGATQRVIHVGHRRDQAPALVATGERCMSAAASNDFR